MTPLPRWVLLMFLLAAAAAYPVDDACVHVCRAQSTSPDTTGACDQRQTLVFQSSGGRFRIDNYLRLCLTPCHGATPSGTPTFDSSESCRTFRDYLARFLGCSCGGPCDDRSRTLQEVYRRLEELEKAQLKRVEGSSTLKLDEDQAATQAATQVTTQAVTQAATPAVDQNQQGLTIANLPADKMKIVEVEEDVSNRTESNNVVTDHLHTQSPVGGTESTDDSSVDWDMWCMAQCDHGQGGSACHCDIIP